MLGLATRIEGDLPGLHFIITQLRDIGKATSNFTEFLFNLASGHTESTLRPSSFHVRDECGEGPESFEAPRAAIRRIVSDNLFIKQTNRKGDTYSLIVSSSIVR